MPRLLRCSRGFTLLELLVVVAIIAVLALTLYSAYGTLRRTTRVAHAENTLKSISVAMEAYKNDFDAYPPDDMPANGSETLWYYLSRVHKVGERECGPYLQPRSDQLKDSGSGAGKKLVSPLGGDYKYGLLTDPDGARRMYLLVDPGLNQALGGSIDPNKGFVTTDPQKAKDNLDSLPLPGK